MQPRRVERCAIEPSQGNVLTLITLHSVPLQRCNWLCSSVTLKNKNFIDILTLPAVFTKLFYHIQPSLWKPYTHHNACKLPFFLLSYNQDFRLPETHRGLEYPHRSDDCYKLVLKKKHISVRQCGTPRLSACHKQEDLPAALTWLNCV